MRTAVLLIALAGVAFGQAGKLSLSNPRAGYGLLGPTRADMKYLPGDSVYVLFDIEGVAVDSTGKAQYSIGMEVADAKGKVLFKQEPRNLEAVNALGGNRLPAHAHLDIGMDQPPGDYSLKVTVVDRTSKSSQVLTRNLQVLPKGFGIVRLRLTPDSEGQIPAPPVGAVGEALHVNCGVVGFERDKSKKQPHVTAELRVLDEGGKPTLPKPFQGVINQDVPEKASAVPVQFLLPLNRPGKFTIELKATDQLSKKSAQLAFPFTVVEAK